MGNLFWLNRPLAFERERQTETKGSGRTKGESIFEEYGQQRTGDTQVVQRPKPDQGEMPKHSKPYSQKGLQTGKAGII